MEDNKVKVKAKFKGISRRFEMPSSITWEKLVLKLSSLFGVNIGPEFVLKYCDDENEIVVISSQDELDEALRVCKKKQGLLNLFIEDPSSPFVENETSKQKKKDRNPSCYSVLAAEMAPEFSAMNERLTKSNHTENRSPNTEPDVEMNNDENIPKADEGEAHLQIETDANTYVNLAEVMAKSNQKRSVPSFKEDSSNSQVVKAKQGNKSSRGWFNSSEDQAQQPSSRDKNKPKKSKKKKKSCYSEVASEIAPKLASIQVAAVKPITKDSVASESDDTDASETPATLQTGAAISTLQETSLVISRKPSDITQQNNQGIQQRENKRPKRSRKHGRKKGCYAQLAVDISPLFNAMNNRIKENPPQTAPQEPTALNHEPEDDDVLPEGSLSQSSNDSFIFVDSTDLQPSSSEEMEMENDPESSMSDDVVTDGVQSGHTSLQSKEQPRDCDSDEEENVTGETVQEDQKDINSVVKEVLNSSMDFFVLQTVEQTVERLQSMNISRTSTSSQSPEEKGSSQATDGSSKVLHKGITCDNCQIEIQGVRYKCGNCKDFDLCEPCESKPDVHNIDHVFVKLKFQAPGIGRRHGEMVPIFKSSVYKKSHERKQKEKQPRKLAKRTEKEEKRATLKELKHVLKTQEKERKERKKYEKQQTDPKALKMAKVYKKLRMEYISEVGFPNGIVVSPGQQFLKTWVICNVGGIAWNQWIKLECTEGNMITPGKSQGDVPHLKPGMQGEVSIELIAPELPGTYSSKWQLTYGLHKFGPQLLCKIQVLTPSNGREQKAVQYDQSTLVNSAFISDSHSTPNVVFIPDNNQTAGTHIILDDGSGSEYHSSEETPDKEQEKDLISISDGPPSSFSAQQRQDLEWDAGCVHDVEAVDTSADDGESQNLISFPAGRSNYSEESDDGDDSDSSQDEYTVLVPPCFDPDVSLTADPIPVRVESRKRKGSFNSQYLPKSFEPHLNIDGEDDVGPSSLPNMFISNQDFNAEIPVSKSTDSMKDQSAPVTREPKASAVFTDISRGEHTPSGRMSPTGAATQRPTETPVSKQPVISQRESIPLVTQPSTITHCPPSIDKRPNDQSTVPTNVVSEVFSSAIDVVATAGRAAIAKVDNLLNGNVDASAVYKPEEDCEVTVNTQPNGSGLDGHPLPVVRAPGNDPMSLLIDMGFGDRRLNLQLLSKHNNDVRATIEELLNHTENDWSSQRH